SPKSVVSVKPDNHVFRGERVTLRCDIQGGGDTEWTYSWYKNKTLYPDRTTQECNFSQVTIDNEGNYTCRGSRSSDSQSLEISDALTLTVSDTAEPVLSVSPLSWLTEGDSVTLSCEVKHSSTGWTFSWYTDVPYRDSQGSLRYRAALLSDSSRGSGGSYTLSPVTLNHTGVYMCRAERGQPVFHTHYSKPRPLCVTAKSPPVSLIISPSRTQHFTADSLSLSCEDQRDSTGWTVRGYTHSETLYNCSSVSGSTCNIQSLSTSHTGVYWCQSESEGCSDLLNIIVHNGDVILESAVHPVTEGNLLTLQCLYRAKISDSRADFYKNNSLFQKQTTGEMTISSVSKSDEGFYHCKHPERGESPKSWVSVRVLASGSSGAFVGLSLVFVFTILIIFLILLLRYKKNKESVEYQTPSAVNQANYQVPGGESIYENAALRSAVDSAAASDITMYSQVVMWKKYHKGQGDEMYSQIEMKNIPFHDEDDSVLGQNDAVYSMIEMKNMNSSDADTDPTDVTYVQIDLTNQTKPKRKQEKRSEEADTVYSELNQNTDQEDFGETEHETYAQVNRKGKRDNAGKNLHNQCKAENPKPELTSNLKGDVLPGDSVTLYCTLKPQSAEWTFNWLKQTKTTEKVGDYRSLPIKDQSYSITSVSVSDGGQYQCRAARGDRSNYTEYSDPLWLNVIEKPRPTVRVSPQSSIYPGDRVTLSCDLQSTGWIFHWYDYQQSNYPTLIDSYSNTLDVTVSNERQITYYCKAFKENYESEFSDPATITVTGIGYQIPSTVNQDNNQPAAHHPIYENSALMSRVDYAAGSSNTMYSQAVTWKKYHKDDSALGENHTVYSMIEMKNMNPKDAATDLSDVIYVEVDLTNQKRPKRKQERRSEEADTVYSELNQNTDQ
ncbi:Fc receptor-like protein 5, partial [Clarias magur]